MVGLKQATTKRQRKHDQKEQFHARTVLCCNKLLTVSSHLSLTHYKAKLHAVYSTTQFKSC